MANVVDISQLSSEVGAVLSMYAQNVHNETEKWLEKTAKETAKDLQKTSPKRSGKYAKSWTATKKDGHWVVHNKKAPGLAHLTEFGHPIVRNGVVIGQAKAQPHIKPAEDRALDRVKELANKLKQVGG